MGTFSLEQASQDSKRTTTLIIGNDSKKIRFYLDNAMNFYEYQARDFFKAQVGGHRWAGGAGRVRVMLIPPLLWHRLVRSALNPWISCSCLTLNSGKN